MEEINASILDRVLKLSPQASSGADDSDTPGDLANWENRRQLDALYREHISEVILSGCTFPNRPIELAPDNTMLINFGTTPSLLKAELLAQKEPPPNSEANTEAQYRSCMSTLLGTYAPYESNQRVYNFESWIQNTYTDCIDVDYADDIRNRILQSQDQLQTLERNIRNMGLPSEIGQKVMKAFKRFNNIVRRANMLENEKSSFTDKRSFVRAAGEIENILQSVDEFLEETRYGHGADIRELFSYYKDASYQIMQLNKKLKSTWIGTELDHRVQDLIGLTNSLLYTARRCAEEEGMVQCSVISARESENACPRQLIEYAFESIIMQDVVAVHDVTTERMEARCYGPLCLLILPGRGKPRFSRELRERHDERLATNGTTQKRAFDIDRRNKYSLNFIVVPALTSADELLPGLCDAWLEYKSLTQSGPYREMLEQLRKNFPFIFENKEDNSQAASQLRRSLSRYLAAFVEWTRTGKDSDLPGFAEFQEWAHHRQKRPSIMAHPRYRDLLKSFADSPPTRREEVFCNVLGPRYHLDRQYLALLFLNEEWDKFAEAAAMLTTESRQSPNLKKALELIAGPRDHNDEKRIHTFIQNCFSSDPDLKSAMLAIKSHLTRDLGTVHVNMHNAGRTYDRNSLNKSIISRHLKAIQEQIEETNRNIDLNLLGLLYGCDGNYSAAIHCLRDHLHIMSEKPEISCQSQLCLKTDEDDLRNHFAPRDEHIGSDQLQPTGYRTSLQADPFVHYNLAMFSKHLKRLQQSRDYFRHFITKAKDLHWHMVMTFAEEEIKDLGKASVNRSE